MSELCRACQTFYGSPATDGMCSSCFKTVNPDRARQLKLEAERDENEWQNALSDDENCVALISAFYLQRHEVKLLNVFKQFCAAGKVSKVREFLQTGNLRETIIKDLVKCTYINVFLSEIQSRLKSVSSNTDAIEAVFEVLLQEPLLRRTVSEGSLMLAISIPSISLVRLLLQVADDGIYSVTIASVDLIESSCQKSPESAKLVVKEIVTEAYERHVAKLNAQGRFQNTGVIINDRTRRDFPTPFFRGEYGTGEYPRVSAEETFNDLSRAIRMKPEWQSKINDAVIVDRWRVEALSQGASPHEFSLVMEQLNLLALIGQHEQFQISPVENVYQSDIIIPSDLRNDFKSLAAALQQIVPVDFHPFSGEQVVDVVHPSLYCATTGLSRRRPLPALTLNDSWRVTLPDLGLPVLETFESSNASSSRYGASRNFQWIPAEFYVSPEGQVQINSYINNLHPETHASLYPPIASIFERALPMVEQVLSDLLVPQLRLVYGDGGPIYADGSMDYMDDDEYENRVPLAVQLPDHYPIRDFDDRYLQRCVNLRSSHLQVIVKIASIELTPEKPEYGGGTWHVEGMRNEHIVCTVIHYYSCDNITESTLRFRQAICEPDYEQNDVTGVQSRFGLEDEDPLNEELGLVIAQEGRVVVFPNLFQHSVSPFRLADPSRPGHRKILVYFVVDPLQRILSSADIPPQQSEWVLTKGQGSAVLESMRRLWLPEELIRLIISYLDFPMSRQQADDIRLRLMDERSRFTDELTGEVFERPFSLCEH